MQIKKLSKKSIQEFSKTLVSAGVKSSVLEIFFDTITGLIDPYEISYTQDMQKIMNECSFESMDDTNVFLKKYNDFTNSVVEFINNITQVKDIEQFGHDFEIIFKTLYDESQKRDSYKILHDKIDQILVKTFKVYEIDMVNNFKSSDDFISYINKFFDDEMTSEQIAMLMSVSTILKEKKVDESKLSGYFFLTISLVAVLNEYRKDELQKTQDNKFFTPRLEQENTKDFKAGRNEPCPCGSGKKYKKCCLHKKVEKKIDPFKELDLPATTHFPLTRTEVDAFYSLWSRLINFSAKLLCEQRGEKYQNLYFKDEDGKHTLAEVALKDNLYLDVRGFLITNFDRIVDDFIDSTRVSEENIKILNEWKQRRLYSDYLMVYERMPHGALVWDTRDDECYYVYDLYDNLFDLTKKDTPLTMLLLPYKGRIIFDGLIAQMGVDLGQNAIEMFLQNYLTLRKSKDANAMLPKQTNTTKIYQLKISIKGAKPPIWRRVLIEDDITYRGLHYVIQNLFEWYGGHLYEFTARANRYTDLEFNDDFMDIDVKDVKDFTISTDLREIGDKITYVYDFGDDWEHEIKLEDILEKKENEIYPKCLKGKGRGPLEDIGGIWAYNDIVEACKTGDKEILEDFFVKDDFDPEEFDLDNINARLI